MVSSQLEYRKIPWHLVLIFLLLATGIGIAGYLYFEYHQRLIKTEKQNELLTIANLKSDQISGWRRERMGDATALLNNPILSTRIHQWFKRQTDLEFKQALLTWMDSLRKAYDYQNIILLDSEGRVRLTVPAGSDRIGTAAQILVGQVLRNPQVVLSDMHHREAAQGIHLDLLAPLVVPQGRDSTVVGVLLFKIDPYRFLFPLIQSWPTPSQTSETLLVRREGEEVVYLNELRHQKNAPLFLRFPVSQEQLPSAMAVQGREGIAEGIDYRKVPVLAAVNKVPDSPWFIVAKIDKEEVYAPLRELARLVGILVSVLIFAAGIMVTLFWQKQRAAFYRRQYEGKLERNALTRHFEYLTKYANDIIILLDYDGRILEGNERAIEVYGYSRDELLRLNARDLMPRETRSAVDAEMTKAKEQDGLVFETVHQRKDGTLFPVEVSSRPIEVDGKNFFQNITRDITERKRVEEEITRRIHELSVLYTISHAATQSLTLEKRLNEALEGTLAALNAEAGGIFLLEPDKETMTLFVHRGLSKEFVMNVQQIKLGEGISGKAAAEKKPVVLDAPSYPTERLAPFIVAEGLETLASTPLLAASELVGALNLGSRRAHAFPLEITELFGAIGQVLGIAIQNARLHEEVQRELTERKQAEEEIGRLNADLEQRVIERTAQLEKANRGLAEEIVVRQRSELEIKRLNEDLERQAVELRAINQELEAFSYSVSHDLRSPLRGMDGFSQALLEDYAGQLDAQGKDYLQRIRAASQHMAQLIDDLLTLSQVTRSEMRWDEVDLAEIAEKIARELREKDPDRQVEFVITPGLAAKGDARLLKIMMENLLGNAWKFTGKHPRAKIEIAVIRLGGARTYYVRDDGVGFDMAYAHKLFIPFQRLHGAEEFPGTGIGLATARRIVHRHGGRVWAEGEVERGATFYFTLR